MAIPVAAVIFSAIKTATTFAGLNFWFLPTFFLALAYYHYDLFDPENKPINVRHLNAEYDFIVVGGGSAGAVVANRLSEIPEWSVLLLEAGGQETEISDVPILSLYLHKSALDWKYRTQPSDTACGAMKDRRCCWTRGKVIGGSSVLNTMLYIRGNRRDFDQWAAGGNEGWSYDEILPYFKKSEDQRNPYLARSPYHATGGYLTIQDAPWNSPLGIAMVQAGEELGYEHRDINGEKQTGFSLWQFTMRRGTRCSTAKAFLRPVRLRKNLHVALHAHVTKVLIDKATRRAYGVQYIRDGVKRTVMARKEVILSAGALNSPQLLMLSGIGPKEHLQDLGIDVVQDLPGVGTNLQDHIATGGLAFLVDQPISLVINRLINLNTALRYAITEDGPLTSNVGLEAVGFINTKYADPNDDWPDIEFMLTSSSTPSDGGTHVKKAHGLRDDFYNEVYGNINNRDLFGIFPMILRPRSKGYIRLRSKNPLHHPLFYHNYLTDPLDVAVMREGVKTAIALGETQSMKRYGARFHRAHVQGCKQYEMFTDPYWECVVRQYTMTIYHQCCTARMGPDGDVDAVLDPQLRVRGVAGLRVIDASVMPNITSGNINAPVIMIGEKGADLIKDTWLELTRRKRRKKRESNKARVHWETGTVSSERGRA